MNPFQLSSQGGHPLFLASVTSAAEAQLAVSCGADVVDAKNPAQGALGALDAETVRDIVVMIAGRVPVSATIGDLAAEPEPVAVAVEAMARTGVDFVKIGLFPEGDVDATIVRLGRCQLGRARLVAVLLADRDPDFSVLEKLATSGFAAAMLDTADKTLGALPDVLEWDRLLAFVAAAHDAGLAAGLAGALRLAHLPALLRLQPDILGFRGALCRGSSRTGGIDADGVRKVRTAIPTAPALARVEARAS